MIATQQLYEDCIEKLSLYNVNESLEENHPHKFEQHKLCRYHREKQQRQQNEKVRRKKSSNSNNKKYVVKNIF